MTSAITPAKTHPSSLPSVLPVFPMPGAVLLPHARLPLTIFEPRYMAMIDDALGKGRFVGVVQPCSEGKDDNQPLYSVGCAGKITSFNETDDGHLLVVLTGVCRFRVAREVRESKLYRTVIPDWQPYLTDLGENDPADIDRERLLALLQVYFRQNSISVEWGVVKNAPDTVLLPTIIMICPLAPNEKQALLEAESFAEQAHMLMTLLEMATALQSGSDVELKH